MNTFDKFFTKFSYKFDKGYPDMDDPKDVLLLESLLSKFLEETIILEAVDKNKSIEAAQDFVNNSKFAKDNEIKKFIECIHYASTSTSTSTSSSVDVESVSLPSTSAPLSGPCCNIRAIA